MKILILIDWFAPAFKGGGPIQSIVNMVENGGGHFQFRVVCSNKDLDGTVLPVKTDQWVTYNPQTEVWYSSNNRKILSLVNREGKLWGADALFINGIYSLHYNILPILLAKTPRKIISVRGTLHDGALSQKAFKKKLFLYLWKKLRLHHKYEFHVSTEEEKGFVNKVFGYQVKVSVAANFPKTIRSAVYPAKTPGKLELVSVALISPMKNHLLVLEALERCKSHINYRIYGPVKDNEYWERCQLQIQRLPSNVTVQYRGNLSPGDVEQTLQSAHVFILPSKSENFGHAIYEALIAGKPVITSHKTPWNGLEEARAGLNATPENRNELTAAIEFFALQNDTSFSQWSRGASVYAKNMIDVNEIKSQYHRMFFGPATIDPEPTTVSSNDLQLS